MTQRKNSEGTCYRVPDLYISSKNLTGCLSMSSKGSDPSVTVRIDLAIPKQRTFHISLSGIRLNCSPVGGIVLSTISNNGDSIGCKALVGSYEEGLVTCPFECKCLHICSHAVAYIYNKMTVSLCKISDWNAPTDLFCQQCACVCQQNIYRVGKLQTFPTYAINIIDVQSNIFLVSILNVCLDLITVSCYRTYCGCGIRINSAVVNMFKCRYYLYWHKYRSSTSWLYSILP